MIPAYIIEYLREREERREGDRPVVYLELPPGLRELPVEKEEDRGFTVIDI
jgi:hypothetical protein